jgi:hypothetical protein
MSGRRVLLAANGWCGWYPPEWRRTESEKEELMYEKLGEVTLKDGEKVEAGRVCGPDMEWAAGVEKLLGHKGPIWNWQNSAVMRRSLDADVDFYLLHRDGVPLANMMTATYKGVGHFGHVWTEPGDRRKGAAAQLMGLLMQDFRQRGGKALFLGTGFDSAPYHIYASHGFVGLEEGSGYMDYYVAGREAFEREYFAVEEAGVQAAAWRHWGASAALSLGPWPEAVRCMPLGMTARSSTEGPWLSVMRGQEDEDERRVRVLEAEESGAVVGIAAWGWEPHWPKTCLVDVYCHPDFWRSADTLLASLELPQAERYVAYSDASSAKDAVLEEAGFSCTGVWEKRVALDHLRRRFADVSVWEKKA